jgi:serine/threonine-protein kinase
MLVRDPDGGVTVKVVDFGIAKTLGSGPSLTRTGIVMGTPSYMAPEQAAGQTDVDHRADIYAIGAILYHMLTGRKPFNSDDVASTLAMVLRDEPERPSTLCGTIPAALELVIQRAMSKLARDRYSSAAELEHVLGPFVTGSRSTDKTSRTDIDTKAATVYLDGGVSEVRAAKGARFRVIMTTLALELVGFGAVSSLTGDGIRAFTGAPLSFVETVLAMVIGLVATVPIAIAWMRHLAQGTWRNTLLMTLHAAALARVLSFSLGLFALVVAGAHFTFLVALGKESVPGLYTSAAWTVALLAIVLPALVGALRRRRR